MPAIQEITDVLLIEAINSAKQRVVMIAPGVWPPLANAIAEAWERLDRDRVTVILDVDPEICRIGYGSLEGLKILQAAATAHGEALAEEPGIRICVVIIDQQTFVFSPTPRQLEAPPGDSPSEGTPLPPAVSPSQLPLELPPPHLPQKSPSPPKANGIVFEQPPPKLESDLGAGPDGDSGRTLGMETLNDEKLEKVTKDLEKNPTKNFDLSRAVNVYNAKLQFVELKVAGCKLSQHKARLPKALIHVLKKNPQLEEKIENSIKLLDSSDDLISGPGLSQESIFAERDRVQEKYLRSVDGVGTVIERARKTEFADDLKPLKKLVVDFARGIEAKLAERFEHTARQIAEELLEEVLANPPDKWRPKLGPHPNRERVLSFIVEELLRAFGTPAGKVGKMKVGVVFKDVTYDMLKDPDFQQQMEKYFPDLPPMDEYRAAREREEKAASEAEE